MNVKTGQQGARNWLARGVGGVVGGAVGGLAGGGGGALGGAMVGQAVTNQLAEAMTSPLWRTVSAVQKAKLARLLTSGKPEAAVNYLGRLMASASASSSPAASRQ
jgi:hypothetical protein